MLLSFFLALAIIVVTIVISIASVPLMILFPKAVVVFLEHFLLPGFLVNGRKRIVFILGPGNREGLLERFAKEGALADIADPDTLQGVRFSPRGGCLEP